MSVWKCEPTFDNPPLTVGEVYKVTCTGESVAWKKQELEVTMPQDWKYYFHVTSFDSVAPDKIEFSAVTYKTGAYDLTDQIFVTDGENKINLQPWKLQVESVIQQQQTEPQPFGPFGPFYLEWPLWMWIVLGVAAATLVGSVFVALWERRRKRLWAALVTEYTTALSPYHEFYKNYRRLARLSSPKLDDIHKLDESLRLYFLRELRVPTLKESADWVLKWLRKKNPQLSKKVRGDLKVIYRELSLAKTSHFTPKDFEQMSRRCQRVVDTVYEGLHTEGT